jgi:hypothetical protein
VLRSTRVSTITILIISLIGLSVLLRGLAAAPTWLHYDENYYLDISQNYIQRGQLTPHMWRLGDDTNIVAGSGSGYGVLVLAWWLSWVGVSLVNGRLLMILAGLAAAGVLYGVARQWWGSRTAGVVALVFALVSTSPFYSLVMRMDALGNLAYSLVLLLHIYAGRGRRPWLHAIVGAAAVLTAEFHILGLLYLLALGFYYALDYMQQIVSQRRLVLNAPAIYFGGAGLIAGLLYLAVHVAPDPRAYFIIADQCMGCDSRSVAKELLRFGWFFQFRTVEALLLVLTLIYGFRHLRDAAVRHVLILCIGWLLAQALVSPPPFIHYTAHIWPLLAIATAGFVSRWLASRATWRVLLVTALAALLLLLNFGLHLLGQEPIAPRHDADPTPPVVYIQRHVPQDTVIMAHPSHYHALLNYDNFLSYNDGEIYGLALRGESQLAFWQRLQPQVIIGDHQAEDPQLAQYMAEMDFEQVIPELWVAGRLRQTLNLDSS